MWRCCTTHGVPSRVCSMNWWHLAISSAFVGTRRGPAGIVSAVCTCVGWDPLSTGGEDDDGDEEEGAVEEEEAWRPDELGS